MTVPSYYLNPHVVQAILWGLTGGGGERAERD